MASKKKKHSGFSTEYYSSNVFWWEWVLAAVIILIALLSSTYKDTVSLTVWSTNLWDVIWEGRLFDFYEYTALNIYNVPHDKMGCDLFAILPMSIWNIPLWIAQYFFHKNIVDSPVMIAWSRLGLEACSCAIAYMSYKMAYLLTYDKKRSLWAAIITLSSAVAIEGVCIAGQNDGFFILYGALSVYSMMKGNNRRAIVFAACSVAVKPFFIFAYLPLVLLTEKNLLKAAANCILSLSLMALGSITGAAFPLYRESISVGPSAAILYNLFNVGVESSSGKSSLFLMGLMAVCFIAYMTKPKDKEERNKFLLYIAVSVFIYISVFAYTDFYRSFLIMPYFAVFTVINITKFRVNLLLSFVFQLFRMMGAAVRTRNGLSINSMHGSVLSLLFNGSEYSYQSDSNLMNYLERFEIRMPIFVLNICSSFYVIAAVIMLVINYPRFSYQFDMEKDGTLEKYDHGFLLLNIIVFLPFLMIMYFLYFYPIQVY